MKKLIMSIFTTTGIALVLVAIIAELSLMRLPFIDTIFQILYANIVIHLGLLLTRKFESKSLFLESLVDVVYITTVLIIFGWVYGWFVLTSIGMIALMAVFIYVIATSLKMGRIREEISEINELLKKRNQKK